MGLEMGTYLHRTFATNGIGISSSTDLCQIPIQSTDISPFPYLSLGMGKYLYGSSRRVHADYDGFMRTFPHPRPVGPHPGHGEISAPKGMQPTVQTFLHPRTCVWIGGSICTVGYDGFMPIFPHSRSSPRAWGNICSERCAANGTDISSSPDLRLGIGKFLYHRLRWIHADISPSPSFAQV